MRLVAPMTLLGRTALSVETITNRSTPCCCGQFHGDLASQDVVEHRFPRVHLQERHMFVGGGVEHHARAVAPENVLHQPAVLDRAQNAAVGFEI